MLMSRKRGFLFIHIYKNAGTSVTEALLPFAAPPWQRLASRLLRKLDSSLRSGPQPFPDHVQASQVIDAIGKDAFERFFSFAVVRNPWDWQVSLYHYMLQSVTHHQHELVKGFGGFDEYVRWRCSEEVRFQRDFIYSEEGELLVNFVARFESIDSDFETICSRLGIAAQLPRLNVSNTKPYREFYSEETRDLVRRSFDADINVFGYDF